MARLRREVIEALRTTAARLRDGARYEWGHAGVCNCGHLAQTVTSLGRAEIYRQVAGEWSEYLQDHCPVTGENLEDLATHMIRFGFEPSELAALEFLTDPEVLARLPEGRRHLRRNERDDVVLYLDAWADLLEQRRRIHDRAA
jgi:hypothetical protein